MEKVIDDRTIYLMGSIFPAFHISAFPAFHNISYAIQPNNTIDPHNVKID